MIGFHATRLATLIFPTKNPRGQALPPSPLVPRACGSATSLPPDPVHQRATRMYDSPAERALLSTPVRSELDPEDHPLTKVRWGNPVVSSTCVLPPHESADRKALFYSRDEEMSNRASLVLEASLVRCVGALILWGVACYALALAARCLLYGKCQVLTPPPSFPE